MSELFVSVCISCMCMCVCVCVCVCVCMQAVHGTIVRTYQDWRKVLDHHTWHRQSSQSCITKIQTCDNNIIIVYVHMIVCMQMFPVTYQANCVPLISHSGRVLSNTSMISGFAEIMICVRAKGRVLNKWINNNSLHFSCWIVHSPQKEHLLRQEWTNQ